MRSYLLRSTSLWKNFPSVSTTSRVFLMKGPEENRITNRRKVYKHKLGNTIIAFFFFSACICMFVCEWAYMHRCIHMRVEAELHIWYLLHQSPLYWGVFCGSTSNSLMLSSPANQSATRMPVSTSGALGLQDL